MSIKPLIFLFFAWLLWGGFVTQSVLSEKARNQNQLVESRLQAQGQTLEWFFQERTLQLKGYYDDEPVVSRYTSENWKKIEPWKGLVFFKNGRADLYGTFDKMMPEGHRKQLAEKVSRLRPAGHIEGVYWDSFQWNGSPFVVAFVSRSYGGLGFLASAEDWGRSLSLVSSDSGWSISNQAGRIIFHADTRYVGEKSPASLHGERTRNLTTTNLVGRLQVPAPASTRSVVIQLILVTLGMALISGGLLNQILKNERHQNASQMVEFKKRMLAEQAEKLAQIPPPQPPPPSNELVFKDLSHRVASSLGRQLQPALLNIVGQVQWLISVSQDRSEEEQRSLEAILRESRQSKTTLDKLLAVAGEQELHLFPMKLETPVLRALKRWEPEFLREQIEVEKKIGETSFYPMNSEALEKALSHLLQNSVEALVRRLDKKIRIEIVDEGETLLLAVEDNGVGIESSQLTLISDPFFTTKSLQNRLGLGLTEAFGILKQHHAVIAVTSEVGKGTRFEIRFDKSIGQKIMARADSNNKKTEIIKPQNDDMIIIPQGLPRPLEMIEDEAAPVVAAVSPAVDEEIEKLLDLSDLDFMESADKALIQTSGDNVDASAPESLIDANPEFVGSVIGHDDSQEEEDDFKMSGISRGRRG